MTRTAEIIAVEPTPPRNLPIVAEKAAVHGTIIEPVRQPVMIRIGIAISIQHVVCAAEPPKTNRRPRRA